MSLKKIIQSEDASWPEDIEKEYTICTQFIQMFCQYE